MNEQEERPIRRRPTRFPSYGDQFDPLSYNSEAIREMEKDTQQGCMLLLVITFILGIWTFLAARKKKR